MPADALSSTAIPLRHGGASMPAVGFGTLIPDPVAAERAIGDALEVGFRHLDCSERYGNEHVVGAAIVNAFVKGVVRRDELFVTTKLWNNNHRPERVRPAFEASLRRLRLDYVDSYLIHTPYAFQPGVEQDPRDEHGQVIYDPGVSLAETWQAMELLLHEGRCRSIGLSDVSLDQLKQVIAVARVSPAVVQIESHPFLPEWEMLDFCRQQGIAMLAFAPLGHNMEPRVTADPVLAQIAHRVGKTPAQVALAWAVQRGTAFLTTSTRRAHIEENFDLSSLPADALQEIRDQIATNVRFNAVVETGVPGFIPRVAK